jgi:hypothetical protein
MTDPTLADRLEALVADLTEAGNDACEKEQFNKSQLLWRFAMQASSILAALRTPSFDAGREARQSTVAAWCAAAFGAGQASSVQQRGLRMLEEAIETFQAAGCDPAMAHKLVDFVFSRPAGQFAKEIGQLGLTTLALANAAGVSADHEEAREVERVLAKPLEHYTARNQSKNDAGFLALLPSPTPQAQAPGAVAGLVGRWTMLQVQAGKRRNDYASGEEHAFGLCVDELEDALRRDGAAIQGGEGDDR